MLDRAFKRSLYSAEEQALLAQLYALIGATEPNHNSLEPPQQLSDPRFSTPESGLYGIILDVDNNTIWQSDSLVNTHINKTELVRSLPQSKPGQFEFTPINVTQNAFFLLYLETIWEFDETEKSFKFVVIHNQAEIKREVKTYQKTLTFWLAGLALMLILIQTVVIYWGLLPLNRLASNLKTIEVGEKETLEGRYPKEISTVTNNLNLLLASEKKQREKYKNTLGDLAHSLKTPLAIIRSQMQTNELPSADNKKDIAITIDEQVERMSNIVQHQLNRASSQLKNTYLSKINLFDITERLSKALQKIYQDKKIIFVNKMEPELSIQASEDDMMELLGNIIENAFKYSNKAIQVSVNTYPSDLELIIEDDGPGIPDNRKEQVLNRGARADTQQPGQGIGLAVAIDIISSYDGALKIEQSSLGGAKFVITLPN